MGVPTIGGDLTGDIDEGDISITGDLDDVGGFTGNNDDIFSITVGATYGTVTIDSATGTWTYALDNSDPAVIALDPGDTLIDIFTVNMLDTAGIGAGRSDTTDITITINGVICFCAGTLVETNDGPCPVETLAVGDLVATLDGPMRPIRWIGRRKLSRKMLDANPKLYPVRITAGSLGAGLPQRDLLVSRQHRLLARSHIAEGMFGEAEVLIPAIKLTELPGIFIDETIEEVEYLHLLFDQHELILAEGAPAESLFTSPQALKALGPEAQDELRNLFQQLWSEAHHPPAARILVKGPDAKALIRGHRDRSVDVLAKPLQEVLPCL